MEKPQHAALSETDQFILSVYRLKINKRCRNKKFTQLDQWIKLERPLEQRSFLFHLHHVFYRNSLLSSSAAPNYACR